jgi:hypothetical protein
LLQRRDATLSPAAESMARHLLHKLQVRRRDGRGAASAPHRRKEKNT